MLTMTKLRKSFLKRFKITKKGKILRRFAGQSHFLAKKSSKSLRRKKGQAVTSDSILIYKEY